MPSLWQDLRFSLRVWAKSPAFCGLTIAILALGLGANITVFGFANALLLSPVSLPEADDLVRVYASSGRSRYGRISYPNYRDLDQASASFSGLAAHSDTEVSFSRGGDAEGVPAELVTGNYFQVLGLEAARGRLILPEDDTSPGAHPVVVISHRLSVRRFGPDETVVGDEIYLNGHPYSVIGIAPRGFQGSYDALRADLWVPLMMHEQIRPRGLSLDLRGWGWLRMTGRLERGLDLARAQTEVEVFAARLTHDYPQFNTGLGFELAAASPLPEQLRESASNLLTLLAAVVALVLLVACANLASVLLSRANSRQREMAIRQSLGATRGRMIQLALVESLSLALAGGLAALVVSGWTRSALLSFSSELDDFVNFAPQLTTDAATLAFTFLLVTLTGLFLGLVPFLQSTESGVDAIREGGNAGSGRRRLRWQSSFVGTQVAVSLLVLIVAGLLVRSLREADAVDPGFQTESLLLARSTLQRHGYSEAQGRLYYRQLRERLAALPGVTFVTFAAVVPLGFDMETIGVDIEGHEPPEGRSAIPLAFNVVGPEYFATMGVVITRGRDFDGTDRMTAPRVVIVNETMAKRFWPGQDAVGQYVQLSGEDSQKAQIVGVARDIKYYSLGEQPRPYLYIPFSQNYFANLVFHLRAPQLGTLVEATRKEAEAVDPNVALSEVMPMNALRRVSLLPNLVLATVSSILAGLTLLLSGLGIYGLISYSVGQRTRELGIRLALGASRPRLLRQVIAGGMTSVIVVGLVAAAFATRLLSSFLFGVSAVDPATFAVCAALLSVVALLACLVPAQRAARVDPIRALRYE